MSACMCMAGQKGYDSLGSLRAALRVVRCLVRCPLPIYCTNSIVQWHLLKYSTTAACMHRSAGSSPNFAAMPAEFGPEPSRSPQVVRGGENPFCKAAAKGEPSDHLLQAVTHDLDVLQQLAVTEKTLATWVKGTAYGVSDAWLEAASSLAAPNGAGTAGGAAARAPNLVGQPPAWLLPPLTAGQRAALMAEIAGQWRWSEAAALLQRYHAAHGFGLVSMHGILTWTGSSLAAQDVLKGERWQHAPCLGRSRVQMSAGAEGLRGWKKCLLK
jgi:hypothetical protein